MFRLALPRTGLLECITHRKFPFLNKYLFSGEVGKEKIIVHGENNEKSEVSREESRGDEEVSVRQSSTKRITWQGFIFQKKWEDEDFFP